MLFMGEEWGAADPFPFFCDFDEELNAKIRLGRKEELKRLPGFEAEDACDPTAEATFRSAKLRWNKMNENPAIGDYYEQLLKLRHQVIVPLVAEVCTCVATYDPDALPIGVNWQMGSSNLHLTANLSNTPVVLKRPIEGQAFFSSDSMANNSIGPWGVVWSLSRAISQI